MVLLREREGILIAVDPTGETLPIYVSVVDRNIELRGYPGTGVFTTPWSLVVPGQINLDPAKYQEFLRAMREVK